MSTTTTRTVRRLAAVVSGLALLGAGLVTAPAASADRTDTLLTVGERLEQGDSLVSPNGRIKLQLDHFGGLKLLDTGGGAGYPGEYAIRTFAASTPSPGQGGVEFVVLQGDGNLVGYGADGTAVANFRTQGSGAVAVRVQDDRNMVFTNSAAQPVASTGTERRLAIGKGDFLVPGDSVTGERGSRLLMQVDGNLVLYRGGTALWSSRTQGNPGAYAYLQGDGNFVVYSAPAAGPRTALFDTGTQTAPGFSFRVVVEDTEVSVQVRQAEPGGTATYPLWGSNWDSDRIAAGDELDEGDRRTTKDGRCMLVAFQEGLTLWCQEPSSSTEAPEYASVWQAPSPRPASRNDVFGATRMQADGNLVHYRFGRGTSRVVDVPFHTGTSVPGSSLVVQDDRNVVVVGPDGSPTWSRLTGRLR